VNNTRAAAVPVPDGGLISSWVRFWFTPTDPLALHVLRFCAGLLFLAWLLPFAGYQESLFGLGGWFDRRAYAEASRLPFGALPPPSWSILYLCGDDPVRLGVTYWSAIGVLVLFTLGVWPRLTAVLAWVVVASFTANPVLSYDADLLLLVFAFYLMLGYAFSGWRRPGLSPRSRLLGPLAVWPLRRTGGPVESTGANVALRLLQVHFALIVVMSGLHKLQFGDWWAGVAFWYALYPPLEATAKSVRSQAPHAVPFLTVLSLGAYAILVWQIGFPLFAWRRRWRILLLGGAALGWVGLAFLFRLPLLGPALLVGCLGYLTAAEWRRLGTLAGHLRGLLPWRQRANLIGVASGLRGPKGKVASSIISVGHRS
jgi:hypothetical protein